MRRGGKRENRGCNGRKCVEVEEGDTEDRVSLRFSGRRSLSLPQHNNHLEVSGFEIRGYIGKKSGGRARQLRSEAKLMHHLSGAPSLQWSRKLQPAIHIHRPVLSLLSPLLHRLQRSPRQRRLPDLPRALAPPSQRASRSRPPPASPIRVFRPDSPHPRRLYRHLAR